LAHDVFISYTMADKVVADAVCHRLEQAGIRCWIAPRDVGFGDWGAAIVAAIGEAKLVVMILSAATNASPNVLDEIVTALDAGRPSSHSGSRTFAQPVPCGCALAA